MSSYRVVMAEEMLDGKIAPRLGSIGCFRIDGRYSFHRALTTARELVRREAEFSRREYVGFYMSKCDRFSDVKTVHLFK